MPKRFKPVVKDTTVYVQGRISYEHLMQPYASENDQEKAYSCCVIIDRDDKESVKALRQAVEAAKKGVASKWGGKEPRKLTVPLRDGDEKEAEEFHGKVFFNCKSRRVPAVLSRDKTPILDAEQVYSGMWAIVCVNMFPYASAGNNGVGAGLEAVLKTADDDAFSGAGLGANAFNDIDLGGGDDGEEDDDII